MTNIQISNQPRIHVMISFQKLALTFFAAAALLASGCAARRAPAIPWNTAVLVRPVVPPPASPAKVEADPAPDLRMEIPPPPPPLVARSVPPRPRSLTPAPAESEHPDKLQPPQIVPDLSSGELSTLRQETETSLAIAERNLAAADGRSLNPAQTDLVSKIRSFISDAREAARSGDWDRARTVAKKAEVLSQELGSSL
ncbi:MAG TPA: hypothetical protein VJN93_17170 [Candidatus Acidoferrum sp.]|nr:hypothetical protein [Candidatus Acidoferrum sp.]